MSDDVDAFIRKGKDEGVERRLVLLERSTEDTKEVLQSVHTIVTQIKLIVAGGLSKEGETVVGLGPRVKAVEDFVAGCVERKKEEAADKKAESRDWGKWAFRGATGIAWSWLAYRVGLFS